MGCFFLLFASFFSFLYYPEKEKGRERESEKIGRKN
jgi:hypothetical protein